MKPMKDRTAIAFLAGFALCYAIGAWLTYNMLITLHYSMNDALPRAALWWWTASVGNEMLNDRLKKYPFKVTLP